MVVETHSPVTIEAEVKKYTLVGDDIYVKRYTNDTIPDWYRTLIGNIISTDTSITDIESAIDYLSFLSSGYHQMISSLQNKDLQIDTFLETLATKDGAKTAAISELLITKTDAASVQAIAINTIGAYFNNGDAGAWFNSQIGSYASNIAANTNSISILSASLNGQEVRIDAVDSVLIAQDLTINQLSYTTGVSVAQLQSQIDGAISTYFYDYVPTLLNYPANSWADTATKNQHLGDLFYDRTTGYGYRFAYADIVDDPDLGIIYTWIRIADTDITTALSNAASAQATADGKSTVYYLSTAPTIFTHPDLKEGDTWINSADNNQIKIWNAATSVWDAAETVWSAKSAKYITAPDGSITGFEMSDGSGASSAFTVTADTFKVIGDGQLPAVAPFSMDTATGELLVNGRISINKLPSSIYIGEYADPPVSPVMIGDISYVIKVGDTYKNLTDGVVYFRSALGWTSTAGLDGTNGTNGINGAPGAPGARGAISAFAVYANLTPTALELAATINQIANPDGCIIGDNVMYTAGGLSGGTKMAYCTAAGNPGTWSTNVSLYVNGSAIINGTLTADKLSANAIDGKTITGVTITGSSIIGTVMYSQYVDGSTSTTLTNKKEFLIANVPAAYAANFVHIGADLLSDSTGYARLSGKEYMFTKKKSEVLGKNTTPSWGTLGTVQYFPNVFSTIYDDVHSYDDYQSLTSNRCIRSNPIINFLGDQRLVYSKYSFFVASSTSLIDIAFLICNKNVTIRYGMINNVVQQSMSENSISVSALNVYDDEEVVIPTIKEYVLSSGIRIIIDISFDSVSGWMTLKIDIPAHTVEIPSYVGSSKNLIQFYSILRTGAGWAAKPKVTISTPLCLIN